MILITGGMGFIGLHVARQLSADHDVLLSYHSNRKSAEELEEVVGRPLQTCQLDVDDPHSVAEVMTRYRPQSVLHLAAPRLNALPPARETLSNVGGLVNLLSAASLAGIRLTMASSSAVYWGSGSGPYREQQPLPVESPVSTSAMKKAEEILALNYAQRTDLDLVILRIGMVYGPLYASLANLVGRLTHWAVRGTRTEADRPTWDANTTGGMDLCYVTDCASAIATVHTAASPQHRIYNVGAGTTMSQADVVSAVRGAVPEADLPAAAPAGSVGRVHMDVSRIQQEFGIQPKYPLDKGIAEYATWLRDHDR